MPSILIFLMLAWIQAAPDSRAQGILHAIDGASGGEFFGKSVSGAGDVDGDGFADVIAGAPARWSNAGEARVVSGRTGTPLHLFHGGTGDDLGKSVSGAGDVDGDGFADVIVGAPLDDNNGIDSGSAMVFSGKTGALLFTFNGDSPADRFGQSVSGAGDVNGDGFPDFIVGAPFDDNNGNLSGSARVFSGRTGAILHTFDGALADEQGYSVSGAGDVNGDGFADLIAGASFDSSTGPDFGSARVYSGQSGALLFKFDGDSFSAFFGQSVSGAGDVDGDGFADLIVGAPRDDNQGPQSGSAQVFSGRTGAVLYTFAGDSPGDQLGTGVSGAGDADGDGFADVIVGAFMDDHNGPGSGSARLYAGKTGALLFIVDGAAAGDNLGTSVGGTGDVNGDALPDVVVGVPRDDNNGNDSGAAWIISGHCGSVASFGAGCPGSAGATPLLAVNGCPTPGAEIEVLLASGLAGANAFLLVGPGMGSTSFAGCTLLVNPVAATILVTLGGGSGPGGFSLKGRIPIPSVTGVTVFLQVFVEDPGAPNGRFSSSNGSTFTVE